MESMRALPSSGGFCRRSGAASKGRRLLSLALILEALLRCSAMPAAVILLLLFTYEALALCGALQGLPSWATISARLASSSRTARAWLLQVPRPQHHCAASVARRLLLLSLILEVWLRCSATSATVLLLLVSMYKASEHRLPSWTAVSAKASHGLASSWRTIQACLLQASRPTHRQLQLCLAGALLFEALLSELWLRALRALLPALLCSVSLCLGLWLLRRCLPVLLPLCRSVGVSLQAALSGMAFWAGAAVARLRWGAAEEYEEYMEAERSAFVGAGWLPSAPLWPGGGQMPPYTQAEDGMYSGRVEEMWMGHSLAAAKAAASAALHHGSAVGCWGVASCASLGPAAWQAARPWLSQAPSAALAAASNARAVAAAGVATAVATSQALRTRPAWTQASPVLAQASPVAAQAPPMVAQALPLAAQLVPIAAPAQPMATQLPAMTLQAPSMAAKADAEMAKEKQGGEEPKVMQGLRRSRGRKSQRPEQEEEEVEEKAKEKKTAGNAFGSGGSTAGQGRESATRALPRPKRAKAAAVAKLAAPELVVAVGKLPPLKLVGKKRFLGCDTGTVGGGSAVQHGEDQVLDKALLAAALAAAEAARKRRRIGVAAAAAAA
mmetsp:Transcript_24102/g.52607  ORF Transcript_24102/g.52607 Transcript_24102/m.52607 type:complete len:612 (+) Transcript_24102:98-1933(+)